MTDKAETMFSRAAFAAFNECADVTSIYEAKRIARAVIASLREPSDGVVEVMDEDVEREEVAEGGSGFAMASAWRAAIDAILTEEKPHDL